MPNTTLASELTSVNEDVNEIRNDIVSMLNRCGTPWSSVKYDHEYDSICRTDAIRRGFPMEGRKSLAPFIPVGVVMATNAYAHLTNKSTQLFIAIYIASVTYIDDIFRYDVEVVQEFNERFMQKRPQGDRVLDCFADLLLELPNHFSRVVSSLILTSTLNLITATSLDYETQGMAVILIQLPLSPILRYVLRQIPACSQRYPMFSRLLSGLTEAYAAFAFPPEIPLQKFVQAIPEMMIFINQGKHVIHSPSPPLNSSHGSPSSDVLSFYKEELVGESVNYISLLAAQSRSSKRKVLGRVADAVVDVHNQTLEILKPHMGALDAYRSFARGYMDFHAGIKRYKLDELNPGGPL